MFARTAVPFVEAAGSRAHKSNRHKENAEVFTAGKKQYQDDGPAHSNSDTAYLESVYL